MRHYSTLTPDERQQLEQLYPVTPNRQLSIMFNLSIDTIRAHFAIPFGWKKDEMAVKLNIRGTYHQLTEREEAWIVRHYKHTRNEDIIRKYGISDSQLTALRRKHGLKKSAQQQRKNQRAAMEHYQSACCDHGERRRQAERARKQWDERRATGDYGNVGFKKGVSNRDRLSPERFQQAMAKMRATRNERIRRDRIRIHWGMEPKTKLVKRWDRETDWHKRHYRYALRKQGYSIERGDNTAYYDQQLMRHPVLERNAQKYGISVCPMEE